MSKTGDDKPAGDEPEGVVTPHTISPAGAGSNEDLPEVVAPPITGLREGYFLPDRPFGRELTGLQKAGMKVVWMMFGLMVGMSLLAAVLVIVDWGTYRVAAPDLQAYLKGATSPDDIKKGLDNYGAAVQTYKELHGLAFENGMKIIDAVVLKALLPLFGTIVGWVIGQASRGEKQG